MHVELKHTLTVDRNVPWFRFYCWLWEADPHAATFCKLFWAYVFIVPGLILRSLIGLIRPVVKWFDKHKRQKTPKVTMKLETPPPAPKGPTTMQRLLTAIDHGMTRVVLAVKAVWGVIGMNGKLAMFLGRALLALALLVGLAALGAIAWVLVEFSTARIVVITMIAIVVVAAIVVGVIFVLDHIGFWDATGDGLTYGGRGIKRGAIGFWGAMVAGYVAIKSNTCPKVEVK